MRFPPYIKSGSTIGVIAPSFGCTTEPYLSRFNEALRLFKDRGYKIKVGECVYKDDGKGISTNPKDAAKELMNFFANPDIDAIISAGGGELMCETMSYVDFAQLEKLPPKWFMGYSDNTNFIYPYTLLCNTASIYGPCFSGFGKPWEQSEYDAIALLEGKKTELLGYNMFQLPDNGTEAKSENPLSPYILTEKKTLCLYNCNQNEEAEFSGILLGGCLDIVENLIGTRFDNILKREMLGQKNGIIWVLEACDFSTMDIRRALWHLKEAGYFSNVKGFIIGRPLAAFRQDIMGVNQYNAVTDILGSLNAPIIMDADIGHIAPSIPIIMGSLANVRANKNNIHIKFIQDKLSYE